MNPSIASRRYAYIVSVLALLLSACAPAPVQKEAESEVKQLVFPEPPDEPRFIYERTLLHSDQITFGADSDPAAGGEPVQSGSLGKPYAIAVRKGAIYVTDTMTHEVKVFDVANAKFRSIGKDEKDGLGKPLGVDVDDQGNVYAVDSLAKVVKVYANDGKLLRRIGKAGDFDKLSSVTVEPSGERVYVVDIGGVQSEHHRVRVFNAVTGQHLFDIGKRGSGPGEFNLPRDVAIGKDGNVIVVDGGNFRVQIFDRDGKFIRSFGKVGRSYGDFARPKEVATDRDGNIYVVDAAFGNFQIFNPQGEMLMFVGARSEQDAPARYMLPSGIAVDEDGRVYIADQWFRKLEIFRPYKLKAEEGNLVHPQVRRNRELAKAEAAKKASDSSAATTSPQATGAPANAGNK